MPSEKRFSFLWNAVKILGAVLLAGYVISRTEINDLLVLHEQIVHTYLVWTFVTYALLTVFKALKYSILIHQDTKFARVLNIVVMQNALSNFLANSAGLASYLAMFKVEEKVKFGRSGLVFLITKIGDLFAVWLSMVLCSLLFWDRISMLQDVVVLLLAGLGVGLALFVLAVFFRKMFISTLRRLLERFHLLRFSMVQQVTEVLDAFAEMEQWLVFSVVLKAFGLSLVYYVLTLVWMVLSMWTFSFRAEIWVIVFVSGVIQLLSFLPVNILGGLGVTEVTSLYFYSLLGANQDDLTAILVGWRILYYLTNLFVFIYIPIYAVFIEGRLRSKNTA